MSGKNLERNEDNSNKCLSVFELKYKFIPISRVFGVRTIVVVSNFSIFLIDLLAFRLTADFFPP